VPIQNGFDLLRRNIGSTANDNLLLAAAEPEITFAILSDEISGMVPPIFECPIRCDRVVPVTHHVARGANEQFALLPRRDRSSFGIYNGDLHAVNRPAE